MQDRDQGTGANSAVAERKKQQSGHTMLETAFILIPFLALLLGIVDFGMAIFVKSTIQNAVAAGTRYAVTFQTKPGQCMDNSIRLVTQTNAMGFLGDSTTPNATAITVNYYSPSNLSAPLGGASNLPSNVVEVTASYEWRWLTLLSGVMGKSRSATPLNVVAYSSDRLGNLAPGVAPPCR